MVYVFWGILGFLLFFLYDINGIKWQRKFLHTLFLFGCFLIGVTTVAAILQNWEPSRISWEAAVLAVFFFGMLINTLFFALPFSDTYIKTEKTSQLCKTGVYALCRHPGVLWFIAFYVFLYFTFPSGDLAVLSITLCICNILYILFQDMWSFPKIFYDYDTYRQETPFLIPCADSVRKYLSTAKKRGESES